MTMIRMAPVTVLVLTSMVALNIGCTSSNPDSSYNDPGSTASPTNQTAETSQDSTIPTAAENGTPPVDDQVARKANSAKGIQANNDTTKNRDDSRDSNVPVIVNNADFHEPLTAAAEQYLEFAMVNSIPLAAPEACAAAAPEEAQPMISQSDDTDSHGKKLYFLFAKEIAHYLDQDGSPSPVGQILVKEAWTSKPSNPNARNMRNHAAGIRVNPRTKVGDQVLEIGRRNKLFIMMKLETDTPETDQGWIYGVVDADSKAISEAGKVHSCMQCHIDAKHDRLFGPASLPQ